MKTFLLSAFILGSFSAAAYADSLTCTRVVEVEGQDFVYEVAPKVNTRIPTMSFNRATKEVSYVRQDGTRLRRGMDKYAVVPPNEEFEETSLGFKTERGVALMNFPFSSHGRFLGSARKYVIGEFYEVDMDSTSWSYLCPLKLKSEIE